MSASAHEPRQFIPVHVTVNGHTYDLEIEPHETLIELLRDHLGLTGTKKSCDMQVCGACTVRLDGRTVRGCLTLAVQCDGREVETIEGATDSGRIADLQDTFVQNNALQCGFCTPGMLLTADELLRETPSPTREEIREHLSGNYCRCTGYQAIVDAVEQVAKQRAGQA